MSGTLKIAGTTLATNPTNSKVEIDDAVNGKGIAKAWVNFDGSASGTNSHFTLGDGVRSSLNVTSVQDLGVGFYKVKFDTNTFSNANYAVAGMCSNDATSAARGAAGLTIILSNPPSADDFTFETDFGSDANSNGERFNPAHTFVVFFGS